MQLGLAGHAREVMVAAAVVGLLGLLGAPRPALAADLGANCNCYCCASGEDCTPVHVGTVSVGAPGDVNAPCDHCTAEACAETYPLHCREPIPGAKLSSVIEPSCDSGVVMNGSPCDISDEFPWSCQIDIEIELSNGEAAVNRYNLKPLCNDTGYNWVDKENSAWFNVNVCGYAPKQCFPANCAADGATAEDGQPRTWTGAPCTPWTPTANVGSVVRFFQDNLDPPPSPGTTGHKGESQSSCFTDDNQVVVCTEACSVPATSMYNEMGASVTWSVDLGDINGNSGLILLGNSPGTAVNTLDTANPLGPNVTGGQTCQPTSEFEVECNWIVLLSMRRERRRGRNCSC